MPVVCDSIHECEGWETGWQLVANLISQHAVKIMFKDGNRRFNEGDLPIKPFMFCPWCGKRLNWIDWERLKKGGD